MVGLGNPGRKYQGTRHNVGYDVLADLSRRFGASAAKAKFQGEVAEAKIHGERVLLLWPQTFMNASGASVVAAKDFYKLSTSELLVVCDDFNLPLAKLR
ncbi:MAG TPA: aminoacyl-tRNA hydrolase, partial [Pirellulales bacterium]|nr:aminoacyl-tRNA hydrolase [Pirellulales bacterium]